MLALVKYGRKDGDVEIREVAEPAKIGTTRFCWKSRPLASAAAIFTCGTSAAVGRSNSRWCWVTNLVAWSPRWVSMSAASKWEILMLYKPRPRSAINVSIVSAATIISAPTGLAMGRWPMVPTKYVVARPQILHHVPDNVPFEHATLTEPICVAYNALVEKTQMKPGDLVVIQSPGPIGIMALQIVRLRGAGTIVVLGTDVDKHRLKFSPNWAPITR